MKKHAIIPIFIPHIGCGHDCVFCNQNVITARNGMPSVDEVIDTIETYLTTLDRKYIKTIEVAFFGGSFTGIPIEKQREYLEIAKNYKQAEKIDKIHLSTRPDYIDSEILDNLQYYGVDVIELGVQSFDEEVLIASKRGHTKQDVVNACEMIHKYGFTLGIQLMIGLPKDSKEKCIYSVNTAVSLRPSIVRIYPTVVLPQTELANMLKNDEYKAFDEETTIDIAKEMYMIFEEAGINVIRVGLKSTELVTQDSDLAGDYHPAFRQVVESRIARDKIEPEIEKIVQNLEICEDFAKRNKYVDIDVFANCKSLANASGHGGSNRKYFKEKYPFVNLKFKENDTFTKGEYKLYVARLKK